MLVHFFSLTRLGCTLFSLKNPLITKLGSEEGEDFFFFWSYPSAYCLVNRVTCCQRSLCECALAEGQSDPLACLSQRGKWRPWYAISNRNVQTVWLLRQAWLAVALPKLCRRNYLFGQQPGGTRSAKACGCLSIYSLTLGAHGHFKNISNCLTSTFTDSPLNYTGTRDKSLFNSQWQQSVLCQMHFNPKENLVRAFTEWLGGEIISLIFTAA